MVLESKEEIVGVEAPENEDLEPAIKKKVEEL